MGKRKGFLESKNIANNFGYKLIEIVIDKNSHNRLILMDGEGYRYSITTNNLLNGHKPDLVGTYNPFSIYNIDIWIMKNRKYLRLIKNQKYVGTDRHLEFFCENHNGNFWMSWHHLRNFVGCPICSGRIVLDKNRLSICFPKVALEWDYVKNEDTPRDLSYASNKKRWWICSKGHSYSAVINNRTNGSGCKQCSDQQQESLIATQLKQWCKETFEFTDVEHRMFKKPGSNQWLRCDIYIGKTNRTDGIYIEFHGHQHYKFDNYYHKTETDFKDSQHRDKIKKKFAKKNGTYIEVDLRKIKTTEEAIKYVKHNL